MTQPSRVRVLMPITRLVLGGAQETVVTTADQLLYREPYAGKYDVEIICGPDLGSEGELQTDVRKRDIPLTIIPGLANPIRPHKDARALVGLYSHMKRKRYDIVHTHSTKAGLVGRMSAKLARVPVIVHTVHGWGFSAHIGGTQQTVLVPMERFAARITDRMITVTHLDTTKGLSLGIGRPEQYTTIRSGIDLKHFGCVNDAGPRIRQELGIPLHLPVIGTVGRFSPQKAPLDFVRAAKVVADAVPDCRFLMVGDGPLRDDVEQAIAATGLTEQFVLPGLRRDIPELMAAFDVFALTSLWEGLPRVLPQAMATGLPVVATSVDGNAEIVQHGTNGYLSQAGDPVELGNHIVRLLQNPAESRTIGATGKQHALDYGEDLMVDHIVAVYEELLKTKGLN